MTNENSTSTVETEYLEDCFDNVDVTLPDVIVSSLQGHISPAISKRRIKMAVRKWPDGADENFKVALTTKLGEVFADAAEVLGTPLLPPLPQTPLDSLRYLKKPCGWSEPIASLDQPLWLALANGLTRYLGIEYKLSVKINTRWNVAPSATPTPRELLTSFGMNPQEFSLYTVDGVDPLPPDTPLSLKRGDCFEAQKDGKYGSSVSVSRAPRGSQTIEDDIEAANESGEIAKFVTVGSQKYVEVTNISVPSPPWGKEKATILIAIPSTYPSGGLDAFYLALPFTHSSKSIPRQQGVVSIDDRDWVLISWHYHESRPWSPLQDDLITHIQHCKGFFLTRGVRQ